MKTTLTILQQNIKNIPTEKNLKYFLIFFSIKTTFSIVTSILATHYDPSLTDNASNDYSVWETFILSVIFAPILETLIFQYALIELLLKTRLRPIFVVAISALLFGVNHHYNLVYILVMTVIGFLFALYYMMLRAQGGWNKILLVVLLHALWNLIAFLNNRIFEWF